jgi:hypothetical protein
LFLHDTLSFLLTSVAAHWCFGQEAWQKAVCTADDGGHYFGCTGSRNTCTHLYTCRPHANQLLLRS